MYVSNAEWDLRNQEMRNQNILFQVDLAADVGTIVNALGANFVVAPITGLKLSNKTV